MSKYNLGIISVLVGVALAALIAVQIYWIQSSVKLKEEEFERSVNEAPLASGLPILSSGISHPQL